MATEAADDRPAALERCGVALELETGRVTVRGRPVMLTGRELEVLRLLMEAAGKTLTAAEIERRTWPEAEPRPGRVAMIIARLRKRLGNPRFIETIGGEGYRIPASNERLPR